ncbi:MAG: SpoIIE family protein phosphatase [Leptospiraceae bacterium]|nr:SpoIIE family protein phosphatase [Leptospiraceae bacterium]MCK6382493.1 SpoIIE family protein phosphatase [Leptospiraceae bacterium]NUM42454.1 SpoIIE family protein phosphatase [Leptospiraceae bacterium]
MTFFSEKFVIIPVSFSKLLLTISIIFFFSCTKEKKIFPVAIKGILDISQKSEKKWEFDLDGNLKLDGEWEFYWKEFLEPVTLSNPDSITSNTNTQKFSPDWINIPSAWNNLPVPNSNKEKVAGAFGFATYRLRILTDSAQELSIKFPYINTSYRLFINGKFISEVGTPSDSKNSSSPSVHSDVFEIPISETKKNEIEILIHVSNYFHSKGGIRNSILLGKNQKIKNLHDRNLFFDSFLAGSIFITGLYHLGLYLLRRKESSPLYLGIFCILMSFRTLLISENYWYEIFPNFPYEVGIKLEYLVFYFGPAIFLLYINQVFPKDEIKILSKILRIFSYSLTIVMLITPVRIASNTLIFMESMTLVGMLYVIYIMIQAIRNRREGAKSFAFGICIIFIAIINDMLYVNQILSTGYFAPFGVFLFFLSQAYLLSIRSSKAFDQVEELTNSLEKKVLTRTNELLQSKKIIETEKLISEEYLKKLKKDLHVARSIQRAILPTKPKNEKLKFYSKYLPMSEVGGDIYHIEEIHPNYIRIFIADVTGHGMQAALITMCVLADYQHLKNSHLSPSEILRKINIQFCERYSFLSTFFTCMAMDIDLNSNILSFSSAGHPAQFKFSSGKIELFERTGRLIGLAKDSNYTLVETAFQPNDKLFLFTDGLYEEINSEHIEYGEDRLIKIIEENITKDLDIIIETTLADLDDFLGGSEKRDDITFIGIEFL